MNIAMFILMVIAPITTMSDQRMKTIGCFITPHGFGHASRATAVIEALNSSTQVETHIYSRIDQTIFNQGWFDYVYHNVLTDIGFIQNDAFHLDLENTCIQLDALLPFNDSLVDSLAGKCQNHSLLLCDISALGIAVAARAQVPSVLLENFTWYWIYAFHNRNNNQLANFSDYFRTMYAAADYHIQVQPVCSPTQADLVCNPIFRCVREEQERTRERLGCAGKKTVLITMGGMGFQPQFERRLADYSDYIFIITGQNPMAKSAKNVILLDRITSHYHPDLINASDIVVFKSGYSTLAECYQVSKPIIFIQREGFAESMVLESFAQQKMNAIILSENDFITGDWLELLDDIQPGLPKPPPANGADTVAAFLAPLL